jgi:Mobilization protein NikA
MTQRDADHHQAHKDDPAEWGDPRPAARSNRRRLAAMISVRFTPQEEQAVRRAAAEKGLSVSRFLRQVALRRAPRAHPLYALEQTRTATTGLTLEWSPDDGRLVLRHPHATVDMRPVA